MVEAARKVVVAVAAAAIPETRVSPGPCLSPTHPSPVCCRQRRGIACQRRRKLKSMKYERRAKEEEEVVGAGGGWGRTI